MGEWGKSSWDVDFQWLSETSALHLGLAGAAVASLGATYMASKSLERRGIVRSKASGPLSGIVVVDLSCVLAGPFSTAVLAELGAEVIKVESVYHPDIGREIGKGPTRGMSGMHAHAGRSKTSIVLDLKRHEGRMVFFDLVKKADVVVENFRPGKAQKLNIGYKECLQINPDIIYVSCTGFGEKGPLSKMPAYDPVVQAVSGICKINVGDGKEQLIPQALVDKFTALEACEATLAALYARRRGGGGQHVSVSMLNVALYVAWPYFKKGIYDREGWFSGGKTIVDSLNKNTNIVHLVKDQVVKDERFKEKTTLVHSSMMGDYRAPNFPATFSKDKLKPRESCPMLGEHTNMVLYNLGYSRRQRKKLFSSGVVRSAHNDLKVKGMHKESLKYGVVELFQSSGLLRTSQHHISTSHTTSPSAACAPLKDLNVLELTYGIAGPLVGRNLSDKGANVVKVEWKGDLDPVRNIGTYGYQGFGSVFAVLNSGKHCRELDYSSDHDEINALIEWADVLVLDSDMMKKLENTRYKTLDCMNNRAIVAMIDRELNELQLQGLSGMSYVPTSDKCKTSEFPIVETATAFYTTSSILAALANYDSKGEQIRVSMMSCAYHFSMPDTHTNDTWLSQQGDFPNFASVYRLLELKDGTKIFTSCTSDREWKLMQKKFIEPNIKGTKWTLKLPKWRMVKERVEDIDDFYDCLQHCAKKYTYKSFMNLAKKHNIMCGKVNDINDIKANEQVKSQRLIQSVKHKAYGKYSLIAPPARFSKAPTPTLTSAQLPDEGRDQVREFLRNKMCQAYAVN